MLQPIHIEERPEESDHRQQKNENDRQQWLLCALLQDFAKNSTVHGLRYLTEKTLSTLEKIFWGTIFVTSVCLCTFAMYNVWLKWQYRPIIITVDDQLMSASEVPFPAVTICPQVKINQNFFNYTQHWITYKKFMKQLNEETYNVTQAELENRFINFMKQTPFMSELPNVNSICSPRHAYDRALRYFITGHTFVKNIKEAAPDVKDIMWYGEWRNEGFPDSYKTIMSSVLMEEGLCFTFNSLAADEIFNLDRIQRHYSYSDASISSKDWSPDGYSSSNHDAYPRRGQASALTSDLLLYLNEVFYPDLLCNGNKGFKLYVHHPADLPQSSRNYHSLQAQEHAYFAIKVNAMSTSDTVAKYHSQTRQCYFPSEKELRYFKTYTSSNCRLECLSNLTYNGCGCVAFHMPHNSSTELCLTLDQLTCVTKTLKKYSAKEDGFGNECQCLPPCYSVQYEAEVTKLKFDTSSQRDVELQASNEINNVFTPPVESNSRFVTSNVEMYFKEARFVSLRRSELFGATDFLANCGGLLGLFLGFSFLSLVELFYYFTLRLCCMLGVKAKQLKQRKVT